MPFTYAILGSGVQGLAAAYDLALHGDAGEIRLADASLKSAESAAERLRALAGTDLFACFDVDVHAPESMARLLDGVDVCLSCIPYHLHPLAAEAALKAGCSLVDMGGDTEDALRTLARDDEAKRRGISIVTDGGVAPGLINLLAVHLISQFQEPEEAKLYCGGLPLDPKPPFHYALAFNVEGLISEYADKAFGVTDGQAVEMESLTDLEELDWPGLGKMEASTTSGGTGTAPFLFGEHPTLHGAEADGGRALARLLREAGFSTRPLKTYEYRTLRFPGHWEKMKLFRDLGFWGIDEVEVEGRPVKPRALFEYLIGSFLSEPGYKDQLLLRVEVSGRGAKGQGDMTPVAAGFSLRSEKGQGDRETEGQRDGETERKALLRLDLHERYDEATGLTAMQRMTGFPVAICAIEMAHGRVRKGCTPFELSMSSETMIEALIKRRINVSFREL